MIVRVAAIQQDAVFADVRKNLRQLRLHVRDAVASGAELVLLPYLFTSAMGLSDRMLKVPIQNEKVRKVVKKWSVKYQVILGGSYLSFDGQHTHNIFELVFPDGEVFTHRQDTPSEFEASYYAGSDDDDNILQTPVGDIGVVLGLEIMRYDILKRLTGEVDVVLSGYCWWDLPGTDEDLRQFNVDLALDAPVAFARSLGVPLIHASHCGHAPGFDVPLGHKAPVRQFVGAAQIIGHSGAVLARKPYLDGAGIITADLAWDALERPAATQFPDRHWIPELPEPYIDAWNSLYAPGQAYYHAVALPYYRRNE